MGFDADGHYFRDPDTLEQLQASRVETFEKWKEGSPWSTSLLIPCGVKRPSGTKGWFSFARAQATLMERFPDPIQAATMLETAIKSGTLEACFWASPGDPRKDVKQVDVCMAVSIDPARPNELLPGESDVFLRLSKHLPAHRARAQMGKLVAASWVEAVMLAEQK